MSRSTSPGMCARASMSPRNASVRAPPVSNDNGGGEEGYCLVQGAPAPSRATSTTPQRISDSTEQSIDGRDCQDVRPVPIVRFTGGQQSRTVSSPQPWPPSGITVSQTFSRAGAPQPVRKTAGAAVADLSARLERWYQFERVIHVGSLLFFRKH